VSAFYRDMSNGAFTFVPAAETSAYGRAGNTNKADAANDGIVHVNLPEAHGNWADSYYDDAQAAGSMLAAFSRALAAADAFVDFARYDSDADGKLSSSELAIAFVIAGYEDAIDGESLPEGSYSLWSHAWSYADAGVANPKHDGVTLDEYIAIAEKARSADDDAAQDIQEPLSVLTHELGHYLGLPDLYDTSDGDGDWAEHTVNQTSLMADGEWATTRDAKGRTSYVPTALDAWSRYQLGWVKPTVVEKGGVYTVSAQDSDKGYSMLLVPTSRKGEYYLIENRTFTGHDAGLAGEYGDYRNGGLVIWHIDDGVVRLYLQANQVNAAAHRPGVMPLYPEEDDQFAYSLKYGSSTPDASSPFWTLSLFKELFGSARYLDLPLYGKGAKADDPDARVLSGIRIEFLDDAGQDMRIRILMPGDAEEEKQESEPQ
jgi:M6 family metalloprotease-like protein